MTQRRHEDIDRHQNFGPQGDWGGQFGSNQAGGRQLGGQYGDQGGRQDQHSQYSSGGGQHGGTSSSRQYGGNDYAPNPSGSGQSFYGVQEDFSPGQERQWGPHPHGAQHHTPNTSIGNAAAGSEGGLGGPSAAGGGESGGGSQAST